MVRCKACGFSNLERDRFCGKCGQAIAAVPEPVAMETNRTRIPAQSPVGNGLDLGFSNQAEPQNVSYLLEDDEPQSRRGSIVLTLMMLLFLGTAGFVLYQKYYFVPALKSAAPAAGVPEFGYEHTPPEVIAANKLAATQPDPVLPSRALSDQLALENISATMRENAAKDRLSVSNEPEAVGARLLAEGEKYLYGRGVPSNCKYAVKSFEDAAAKGNARAMAHLGSLYGSGRCVKFDRVQAYQWFTKAKAANPDSTWYESSMDMLWRNMSRTERAAILK